MIIRVHEDFISDTMTYRNDLISDHQEEGVLVVTLGLTFSESRRVNWRQGWR